MADLDQQQPNQQQPNQQQQSDLGTLTPWGWVPARAMSNLWQLLITEPEMSPPAERSVADYAGAPMDVLAGLLHRLGMPIPGAAAPYNLNVWRPAASVPFSSQNIRGLLDSLSSANPPTNALLRGSGRPGPL
jgi:hypothetical protein